MRSRLFIVLILLLMTAVAGNAFAQTATILPSAEIPVGAYVNGPEGDTDDNYYFINIKITYIAAAGAGTCTITLPTDITIAQVVAASAYSANVNISWSAGAVGDFTLGGITASSIIVNEVVAAGAGDILYVMIPVEVTETATGTDNITIVFSDANLTNIGDLEVTYKDPSDLSALTLTNILESVDPLETLFYGLFYPGAAAAMTAALPDLATGDDGNLLLFGSAVSTAQGVILALANYPDGSDVNDVTYTLWYSTQPDISKVIAGERGVVKLKTYDPLGTHDIDYVANETGTCVTRFITSTIPEGDIYVYITSSLTGDFPLARSDAITIHHEPIVKRVVWDYDNDALYEPLVANDDQALTLDTGNFLGHDGAFTGTPRGYVDIYFQVDDYDDNAAVALFRGTVNDLTDSDITFSGLDITGLGSGATEAVELMDGFFSNDDIVDGYIKWRWLLPTDASYVDADDYYIYAVATDGTNAHLSCSRGFANWTDDLGVDVPLEDALAITVKNSPYMRFNVLSEYDIDGTPNDVVQIDTALDDVIMINWGKAKGLRDKDIDDSATIELYIDYDTTDDFADYTTSVDNTGATTLRNAVNDETDGVHLIWSGGLENNDDKSGNWYAWDLRQDYIDTGWYPTVGGAAAANPHYNLYAIIDEDGPAASTGIARVIALNSFDNGAADDIDDIVEAGETLDHIWFINSGYARPFNPPQKGVTVDASQTYRFEFDAYDLDGDGVVGIFILRSDVACQPPLSALAEIGPLTTTPLKLNIAAGVVPASAYCVNSAAGDDAAIAAITEVEGTEMYYDWTPIVPGAAASTYITNTAGAGAVLADDEYYVYVGIDVPGGSFGGAQILYRATGTLTLSGIGGSGAQKTFRFSPDKIVPTEGETTTVKIMAVDYDADLDMADIYVAVPKTYFSIANQSSPCTLGATLVTAGGYTLAMNETIETGDNWIVHCTLWKGAAHFAVGDIAKDGAGTEIASFQITCLGTEDAVEAPTSMVFLQDPGNGWESRYEVDGAKIPPAGVGNAQIMVQPRTIIEGVVQFEGRDTDSSALVTLELRKRGTYEPVSDTSFEENDDDGNVAGVQIQLDVQGKFQLTKVPTGDWDFVISYNRYLAVLDSAVTGPGIDNLLVDFGLLRGGDATGYTDPSGNDLPNNAINQEDVTKIVSALGKEFGDPGWDVPDNDKYCDINEDTFVTIADLSMATGNYTATDPATRGAEPVFLKSAVLPVMNSNLNATVEFVNLPREFKAGETYTIQVVVNGAADVKGYFINLEYDKEALTFGSITKGDFLASKTASRSLVKDGMIGLANAVYGSPSFNGDGVLAEVSFTANVDAVFSSAILGIEEAAFVNSRYIEEGLELLGLTYEGNAVPALFKLEQNFPNPFNPTTSISFNVPTQSLVSIKIYDILGRHMRTLVDGNYSAGNHTVVWDATDMNGIEVSAGIYFYTIESDNFRETRRMLFMK